MMTTGMLREGKLASAIQQLEAHLNLDGIHVDMDHLKKGEVKYATQNTNTKQKLTSTKPRHIDVRTTTILLHTL